MKCTTFFYSPPKTRPHALPTPPPARPPSSFFSLSTSSSLPRVCVIHHGCSVLPLSAAAVAVCSGRRYACSLPLFFMHAGNDRLIVANTHLYFHPNAAHIRLMQLVALVERCVYEEYDAIAVTGGKSWSFFYFVFLFGCILRSTRQHQGNLLKGQPVWYVMQCSSFHPVLLRIMLRSYCDCTCCACCACCACCGADGFYLFQT